MLDGVKLHARHQSHARICARHSHQCIGLLPGTKEWTPEDRMQRVSLNEDEASKTSLGKYKTKPFS